MEFEAFGKTFTFGKKAPEPDAPLTEEELLAEAENFEFVADIATINAIPEEITRRYRVQGVAKKYGLTLASIIVIFGLLWVGTSAFLSYQAGKVTSLNEERDLLKQESDTLSPFQDYKQALDNKRSVLANSTQTDINYGEMYDILTTTANTQQVMLKTIDISQFAEEGETGGCVSPDPLNQTSGVIGCVTLTATTASETNLINFLRGLESNGAVEGGFTLPSIASFTSEQAAGEGEATTQAVNMSIFFTNKFYSGKYDDLMMPIEELIAAKLNGGKTDKEEEPAEEMSFEDQMVSVAFRVSDTLKIEGTIDNLELLTDLAMEVCETGEPGDKEVNASMLASQTESLTGEDIIEAVREKC